LAKKLTPSPWRISSVCAIWNPDDIVQLEGRQHFWHEGRHVGLVAASQLLQRPPGQSPSDTLKVVVIRERDAVYGIAVERFIGERTLVVLPLDDRLGKVQDISAGALLDDGSVVLIVDVEDMLRSVDKLLNTGRLERIARRSAADRRGSRANACWWWMTRLRCVNCSASYYLIVDMRWRSPSMAWMAGMLCVPKTSTC
jgi:hypothetical protein